MLNQKKLKPNWADSARNCTPAAYPDRLVSSEYGNCIQIL